MRTLYIDERSILSVTPGPGCREIVTDRLDGFPDAVVACYRYAPADDTHAELVQAWRNPDYIAARMAEAEARQWAAALESENKALLADMAQMVEEIYASDLEIMQ